MHNPHKTIMYSRKKIHKTEEIPHKFYFKAEDAEISKDKEYSNLFRTYCDADYDRDIYDRHSVTFTVYIFNGTIIDCFSKKKSETLGSSSNA